MQANDYQTQAHKTAIYPQDTALEYLSLGIGGEVGELQSKIAKVFRSDKALNRVEVLAEVGDVLWFCAELCTYWDTDMSVVMENNLAKLKSRAERGVLKGDGDDR